MIVPDAALDHLAHHCRAFQDILGFAQVDQRVINSVAINGTDTRLAESLIKSNDFYNKHFLFLSGCGTIQI